MSRDLIGQDLAYRRRRILNDLEEVLQCTAEIQALVLPQQRHLAGVAWFLGAIYNEIEEIFKSVAKRLGEPALVSSSWHQELLEQMARPTASRRAVLSPALYSKLVELLGFRHVSRHATSLDLDWAKMRPLVESVEQTVREFLEEMETFLRT